MTLNSTKPTSNRKRNKFSNTLLSKIATLLLVTTLAAVSFMAGYFARRQENGDTNLSAQNFTYDAMSMPESEVNWKSAKFGSMFTYEYPQGWHVGEIWQEELVENGIMIAIDPNPINTAPRGGPISVFQLSVINANENADELLTAKMAEFNDTVYTDIQTETIQSESGEVYYYKGNIAGDYMKGSPVESYFFTVKPFEDDPSGDQVVVASMAFRDDKDYSEMLRHIVMSVKEVRK